MGPNPSKVLDILEEHNVKSIAGNSEDYSTLGIEPFSSYFNSIKQASQEWTFSQLTSKQIEDLKKEKHSYDLIVGGLTIGLCHFANDVRIDFGMNSTWSYKTSINNPKHQFYYTNSELQQRKIENNSVRKNPIYNGYKSAKSDPLFNGKTIDTYDEIFQGHVHFSMLTEDDKVRIRTLRAVSMGYGKYEPIDYASYIIIKEKVVGYDVEEILVKFDRDKMLKEINVSDMPDKETITRFTSKK